MKEHRLKFIEIIFVHACALKLNEPFALEAIDPVNAQNYSRPIYSIWVWGRSPFRETWQLSTQATCLLALKETRH